MVPLAHVFYHAGNASWSGAHWALGEREFHKTTAQSTAMSSPIVIVCHCQVIRIAFFFEDTVPFLRPFDGLIPFGCFLMAGVLPQIIQY